MEVLSFFLCNINLVNELDAFLLSYNKLELNSECEDTKYFIIPKTKRNEIYLHFIHNNIDHELIRDYTFNEQKYIKNYFNGEIFYFFDIQYKDEIFLKHLITDFQKYLKDKYEINYQKILISDVDNNLLSLENFISIE